MPRITTTTNEERRERAQEIIDHYAIRRTDEIEYDGTEAPGTILSDLLTDLRHWSDREEADFDTALTTSEVNYECEK